jgi:hypothetical protein
VLSWLDRLPADPVAAMREFLLGWYPGPAEVAPVPADLPTPLAELYAVAAGRPDALGTQNGLFPPGQLYTDPDEGLLVFGAENQGGFRWMIDPAEDDPAVWLVHERTAPVAEREPLSGFLVQFSLMEAIAAGPLHAYSWSGPPDVNVTRGLREVPLEPWQWPGDPTCFFVGPDLVVCTSVQGHDDIAVLAGARTPAAVRFLTGSDVEWDHVDED